jgi:hypothetical protein
VARGGEYRDGYDHRNRYREAQHGHPDHHRESWHGYLDGHGRAWDAHAHALGAQGEPATDRQARANPQQHAIRADLLQPFSDVAQGAFAGLDEIPRVGMHYLDHPATGAKIHLAWGQHMQPEDPVASHAWFDPSLSAPDLRGAWFIGHQSLYAVNGYLLGIPAAWAAVLTRPLQAVPARSAAVRPLPSLTRLLQTGGMAG